MLGLRRCKLFPIPPANSPTGMHGRREMGQSRRRDTRRQADTCQFGRTSEAEEGMGKVGRREVSTHRPARSRDLSASADGIEICCQADIFFHGAATRWCILISEWDAFICTAVLEWHKLKDL